jgi:anti-anti-sigma factor
MAQEWGRNESKRTWRLHICTELVDEVVIHSVSGRIGHASARAMAEAIEGSPRPRRLVVDLSGVDYVSSAGVDVLATAAKRCKAGGGILVLAVLTDPVRLALDLAGLVSELPIETTLDAAVARARAHGR